MYAPLYKTWWFRLGLIILLAMGAYYASYLPAYLEWRQAMKPYDEQNKKAAEYYAYLDQQKAQKEALYRADTYGGDTPEETLELFITALEAGDYELAAKYVLPENQESALAGIKESNANKVLPDIIKAYHFGTFDQKEISSSGVVEISLTPAGEKLGFLFRFLRNEFSQKWKIEEF